MYRAFAALFLLLTFLLCFAESASARAQLQPENRVGVFSANPNISTYAIDPLALQPQWEDTTAIYDPATGVLFYVNQNPWTYYDPHGLFEWNEFGANLWNSVRGLGYFASDGAGTIFEGLSGGYMFPGSAQRFLDTGTNAVNQTLDSGGDLVHGTLQMASGNLDSGLQQIGGALGSTPEEQAANVVLAAVPFVPNALRKTNSRRAAANPGGLSARRVQLENTESINFSQRTVSENVNQYTADMRAGEWDWNESGPIRVMEVDGQLVSYDNRRLMAAQNAELQNIPTQRVNPNDIMPGSKKTWQEAFDARFNDPRNVRAGGRVPKQGLKEQPEIKVKKQEVNNG